MRLLSHVRRRAAVLVASLLAAPALSATPAQALISPPPSPTLLPTVSPLGFATPGVLVPFRVRVTNAGPRARTTPVTVAVASDSPPSGEGWTCEGSYCTTAADVAPEASLPDLVVTQASYRGDTTGEVKVTAYVVDDAVAQGYWARASNVAPLVSASQVDLAVSASASGPTARVGADAEVELVVRNLGAGEHPGRTLIVLTARGTVAVGSELVASGEGWTCVRSSCWTDTPLAPGDALPPLHASVLTSGPRATDTRTLEVTGSVYAAQDVSPANDSVTVALPVVPSRLDDLEVTAQAGDPGNGQVRVTNVGQDPAPAPVVLEVPAGASGVGWSCTATTCTHPLGAAPGEVLPVVVVPASGGFSARLVGNDDADSLNDTAVAHGAAAAGSGVDLAMRVEATGTPPDATFRVVPHNAGTVAALGPVVVDLASGERTVTASGAGWTCLALRCTHVGAVAAGTSVPELGVVVGVEPGDTASQVGLEAALVAAADDGDLNGTGLAEAVLSTSGPALTVTAGPPTAYGQPVAFTATVRSTSAIDVAGPFVVQRQPTTGPFSPPPVSLAGVSADGWTCSTVFLGACSHPGPLPAGGALPPLTWSSPTGYQQPTSFVLPLALVRDGALSGRATATTGTAARPTVDLVADLRVGGTLNGFEAVVRNIGRSAGTGPVTVSVVGASGPAEGPGWTCAGAVCTHPGPVPSLGALPPLSLYPHDLALEVDVSGGGDQLGSDNHAQATAPRKRFPLLLVPRVTAPVPQPLGSSLAFTVTSRNEGRQTISAPRMQVVATGTASGSGWTCRPDSNRSSVCDHAGSVATGEALPPIQVVVPPSTQRPVVVAAVASSAGRSSAVSSAASSLGGAVPRPVAYVAVDGPLAFGEARPVQVLIANGSPVEARNVVVTDYFAVLNAQDTGAGPGWTCTASACTHPGPVPAYGTLPLLTLRVRLAATDTGSGRTLVVQTSATGAAAVERSEVSIPAVRSVAGTPRVAALSPGTAGPRAPTGVAFSRDVTGVSASTVQLRTAHGALVPTTLTCYLVRVTACTGAVRTVVLTPTVALGPGVLHRVLVSAGVSAQGAPIAAYVSLAFRSWAPTWRIAISPLRLAVRRGTPVTLTAQVGASPAVSLDRHRMQIWVRKAGQTSFSVARELRTDSRGFARATFTPAGDVVWFARHLGPDGDVRSTSAVGLVRVAR